MVIFMGKGPTEARYGRIGWVQVRAGSLGHGQLYLCVFLGAHTGLRPAEMGHLPVCAVTQNQQPVHPALPVLTCDWY